MRTWKDVPELRTPESFRAALLEAGSFDALARRLSCDRMSVRHAAKAHRVRSPYFVVPKYLKGR